MASASKTPNLNLPQWVGTEKPERTDFNAAFDAIDDHVAESASKHIRESGSNDDGYYIKFDDGTMVCYGAFSSNSFINNASGGGFYKTLSNTWTFPQPFNSANIICSAFCRNVSNTFGGNGDMTTSTASGTFVLNRVASQTSPVPVFNVKAIGRWK